MEMQDKGVNGYPHVGRRERKKIEIKGLKYI